MKYIPLLLLLALLSCGKKTPTEQTNNNTPMEQPTVVEEIPIDEEPTNEKWGRSINHDGDIELFTSLWWTEEIDPYWKTDFEGHKQVKRVEVELSKIDTSLFSKPPQHLEQDTLFHPKVDGRITLPLRTGKNIILIDTQHDNDAMATYRYKGYVAATDQYIIDAMMWERYSWLTINKSDGTYTMIGHDLCINKDQTLMFSYSYDPYGEEEDIYLYEIEPQKGFKLIYKNTISQLSINSAYWQGNSIYTVSNNPFSEDSPIVYHRIDIE